MKHAWQIFKSRIFLLMATAFAHEHLSVSVKRIKCLFDELRHQSFQPKSSQDLSHSHALYKQATGNFSTAFSLSWDQVSSSLMQQHVMPSSVWAKVMSRLHTSLVTEALVGWFSVGYLLKRSELWCIEAQPAAISEAGCWRTQHCISLLVTLIQQLPCIGFLGHLLLTSPVMLLSLPVPAPFLKLGIYQQWSGPMTLCLTSLQFLVHPPCARIGVSLLVCCNEADLPSTPVCRLPDTDSVDVAP